MPKSKHRRKGDKRPVRRNSNKEWEMQTSPDSMGRTPTHNHLLQMKGMPNQPPEPQRQIKFLDRVATLPKVFTKDQCADLINNALNNWGQQESMIQKDEGGEIKQNFREDLDYRNTTLFVPPKTDDFIFTRVLSAIQSFNNQENGYQFDIQGLAEPPNMMRYQAPDINKNGKPGRYDWHMDVGPGPIPSMRKISYSILLNPGEYEGGELCFHIGRYTDAFPGQTDVEDVGNMILFPSYIVHRVLPVTKGTRYSLVGWAHGNSFL